ncbi:C-C motif chemokine 25b precursor [Danio rerio]|uniref:C-C motif chemokine 25 n=1 Tax=Danio rerio TaxID=7955 RepID=F1QBE9_DANRE|nr:C-C motif chemokine 25b precursor [Danio rerio]|eukprot:NP_001186964.1 chemokine CCL-C11a precursor [Danio rerio]
METQSSTMKFQILALLLLLACMYPSIAQGYYENCCLKYVTGIKKNMRRNIMSYRVQLTDGGCNIPAVVFKMRLKKQLKPKSVCADPRSDWVQAIIKELDEKNKRAM